MLLQGSIDLALTMLPHRNPDLHYDSVVSEEIFLAVNRFSPLLTKAKKQENTNRLWIAPSDIPNERIIMLPRKHSLFVFARDLFRSTGFYPKDIFKVKLPETALRLASSGIGATFVPELITGFDSQAVYLSLGPNGKYRKLGITYRPDGDVSKSAVLLGKMITEIFMKEKFK